VLGHPQARRRRHGVHRRHAGHAADESAPAAATAREIGLPHTVLAMSALDDAALDDLSEAYAEPFACASALGMIRVSQAVRASATVLLTGDGGDDVFLGYARHRWMQRISGVARWVPQPAGLRGMRRAAWFPRAAPSSGRATWPTT
jgi:asparagine synthase (glutamine-hydrolysing)